jgi:hypothetical protein
MKYSLRDLLWLTVVVALATGWFLESRWSWLEIARLRQRRPAFMEYPNNPWDGLLIVVVFLVYVAGFGYIIRRLAQRIQRSGGK